MKPTGNWPTKIRETLDKFDSLDVTIGAELAGGKAFDVTSTSVELIRDFAPDVKILGWQLRSEKDNFGGVLYRAVKNEKDTERCLQYIYVYTRQIGAVSLLWMVIVPLIMGLWSLLVRNQFSAEILLVWQAINSGAYLSLLPPNIEAMPLLLTGGVWTPMLLAGLAPHIGDYLNMSGGNWFFARSTTLLIIFGIMEWFVVFSPLVPLVLILIGVACLIYFVLEQMRMGPKSAHDMDYAPIFVWVRELTPEEKKTALNSKKKVTVDKSKSDYWRFKSACWDYYHYHGMTKTEEEMERSYGPFTARYLGNNKRVRLLMDNPWHSFFLGSQVVQFFKASVILFPMLLLATGWFVLSGVYATTYPNSVWLLIILGFFIVLAGRTAARYPFSLVDDWLDFIPPPQQVPQQNSVFHQHLLNSEKLGVLWNLKEKQARFAIISKMQNPFHLRSDFYDTFRDEPEYLLYDYGVTKRLQELEEQLVECRIDHADTLARMQEPEAAEQVLLETIEFNRENIRAWEALGDFYLAIDEPNKAVELFRDAIEERPDLGKTRFAFAVTLDKMGRNDEAKELYAQAIEIESSKFNPEQSIRQMVELKPDVPEAMEAYEKVLELEGRLDEVEEIKRRAIAKKARAKRERWK